MQKWIFRYCFFINLSFICFINYNKKNNKKKCFRLGYTVAKSPIKTIAITFTFTVLCGAGSFKFYKEKNPLKLWIPPDSKFLRDTEWLMKSFQEGTRPQSVLITADDVLQPSVFLKVCFNLNE